MSPHSDDDTTEHDRLLVLAERIVHMLEERFGMKAQTAVSLLQTFAEREEQMKSVLKGILYAFGTVVGSAIIALLIMGLKAWKQ